MGTQPLNLPAPMWRVQLIREGGASARSQRPQITCPGDMANLLLEYLASLDREHLIVGLLDTKNRVIGFNTVTIGNINSAIVSARETFKPALLANATAVILAHNHPSGDPTPSPEDIQITRSLAQAGNLLGIEVLDHLVIGDERYVSLKERGLL